MIRTTIAPGPREGDPTARWHSPLLFVVVTALALLRMVPWKLEFEEPFAFWDIVPTMNPLEYLIEPWAGYLQIFARFSFLVAYPFDDVGPLLTRLIAAAVIGLVAVYLASGALADAIPSRAVRTAFALSLPIMPIFWPGPYVGPLNSQWWIALGVLGIALARPRSWHYPVLIGAGLTGIAPCVVLPVFRDRRGLALAVGVVAQGVILLLGERRSPGFAIGADYVAVMLFVGLVMLAAPLPSRTRLAFTYVGVTILALGAIFTGWGLESSQRYLALPGAAIALGLFAILLPRGPVMDDPGVPDPAQHVAPGIGTAQGD